MSDNQGRGNPDQPSGGVITEAAPANSSSLNGQDFAAKATAARSPREVRALLAQSRTAMEQALKTKPEKPQGDTPVAEGKPAAEIPPDLKAAAEETPAPEVAPEATGEEAPQAAAPEEPAQVAEDGDDEAEGDGPITPVTGKRAHLRLAENDSIGRLAASLMKRNRDLPMSEAVDKAKAQLGIKAPSEETPAAQQPKSDMPETVEATDSEIEKMEGEFEKAGVELRFEDQAKINRSLRKLDRHRIVLERDGERKSAQQADEYNRQFDAAVNKASELYAFVSDPESAGAKRMLEIESVWKANDDPMYFSPNKALKAAQIAASELLIAPKKKGATTAPVKPAAPAAPPTVKKQVLATGGSRTTAPTANQKPAIDTKVQAAKNLTDLRSIRKELGLRF